MADAGSGRGTRNGSVQAASAKTLPGKSRTHRIAPKSCLAESNTAALYQRPQATWTLSCSGNVVDLSENRITSLPNTTRTSHSSWGTGVVLRCGCGWLHKLRNECRQSRLRKSSVGVGITWANYDPQTTRDPVTLNSTVAFYFRCLWCPFRCRPTIRP